MSSAEGYATYLALPSNELFESTKFGPRKEAGLVEPYCLEHVSFTYSSLRAFSRELSNSQLNFVGPLLPLFETSVDSVRGF